MSTHEVVELDKLLAALKKSAAALRDAEVPFALGGGFAAWARGGPEVDHDVDLLVPPGSGSGRQGRWPGPACASSSRPRRG